MHLDPRGVAAAGRVEHHGLQLGTATAERVLLAYHAALTTRSATEDQAGDVEAIINLLSIDHGFVSPCMARLVGVAHHHEARPTAVDQVMYLEPPPHPGHIYDLRQGYEDVAPARVTQAGKYRLGPNDPWRLRLVLSVREIITSWPHGSIIMFIQRAGGRSEDVVGMVLERVHIMDLVVSSARGDDARTNIDVVFGHAAMMNLRSSDSNPSSVDDNKSSSSSFADG